MDIPCFIYHNLLSIKEEQRKMDMEKSSVQPHVVIKVLEKGIDIVETEGQKRLFVRTGKDILMGNPGEIRAIEIDEIDLGTIEVLEADKPLKLVYYPLQFSPSVPVRIGPVGVSYNIARKLGSPFFFEVTVLKRKGPIKVRDRDGKVKLVYATPIPELSTPYEIRCHTIYTHPRCDDQIFCYFPSLTPLCYFGFSFLNDQGEWEPLKSFKITKGSGSLVEKKGFEVVEAVEAE
jgi:hypothetical protein